VKDWVLHLISLFRRSEQKECRKLMLYVEQGNLYLKRDSTMNYSDLKPEQLELALRLLVNPEEQPLPESLQHLQQEDWMSLAHLLMQLEQEKQHSRLH
jgi:hypothetical protein